MKIQNKSLFAGNSLFGKQEMDIRDRVAMKKQLYQKEGMHVVTSANKSEKRIDKNIDDMREHVRLLQEENDEANAQLNEIWQQMNQVKEDYGVEDDSQEQRDLELLEKLYDTQKKGGSVFDLSEEEQERLKNMGEMTEYQQLSMELYEQGDYYKTTIDENELKMAGETYAVRKIKIERLKSHAMVDAEKAKEELLAAASKEAMSMMVEDAKSQIDEKAEEVKEAAEDRKEKEEEEEKRIEAAKEDKTQAEAVTENIRENISNMTEQVLTSDEVTRDIEDEIKKIMAEEKLLEEDLKGLTVNTGV